MAFAGADSISARTLRLSPPLEKEVLRARAQQASRSAMGNGSKKKVAPDKIDLVGGDLQSKRISYFLRSFNTIPLSLAML